jgi:hypothetical protein
MDKQKMSNKKNQELSNSLFDEWGNQTCQILSFCTDKLSSAELIQLDLKVFKAGLSLLSLSVSKPSQVIGCLSIMEGYMYGISSVIDVDQAVGKFDFKAQGVAK